MECYVFESENVALSALAYIDAVGECPIIGRNSATGELEPNSAKTETWAIVRQRVDGKYFFPRVDEEKRQMYPEAVLISFQNNYNYTLEIFDDSWVPASLEV